MRGRRSRGVSETVIAEVSQRPVLMVVWMTTDAPGEEGLNKWYEHHVPALLSVDGFVWGRRYKSTARPHDYLALYAIRDFGDALKLRPRLDAEKPPVLAVEFERFQKLVSVRSACTVLYTQQSGPGFDRWLFAQDEPIVLQTDGSAGNGLAFARLANESLDQDLEPGALHIMALADINGSTGSSYRPLAKYWP